MRCSSGLSPHDERLDAPRRRGGRRVGVDRKEQVALGLVGDVGPRLQILGQRLGKLLVGLAGVDHLHFGKFPLDERAQFERHFQVEILLVDSAIVRSGKFRPAVARIDDDNPYPARNIFRSGSVRTQCEAYAKRYDENQTPHGKSGINYGVSLIFYLSLSDAKSASDNHEGPIPAVLPTRRQRYEFFWNFEAIFIKISRCGVRRRSLHGDGFRLCPPRRDTTPRSDERRPPADSGSTDNDRRAQRLSRRERRRMKQAAKPGAARRLRYARVAGGFAPPAPTRCGCRPIRSNATPRAAKRRAEPSSKTS